MLPRISLVEGEKAKFLVFSTKDAISNNLFVTGLWEDNLLKVSKFFYDAIESPLILDIGANLGAYSIPIAKDISNKNGTVIGFEPQRIIFYQLCANVFINRLDNYYVHNMAVSDIAEKIKIPEFDYSKNNNIGAFSLDKDSRVFHGIESAAKEKEHFVDAITLDSLEVDKTPALIKIDVEGFEINVLRGGLNFLENHKYPPILFEAWNFEWFAAGKIELLNFLTSIGYDLFQLDATNFIAQHPKNGVFFEFKRENNVVRVNRVK